MRQLDFKHVEAFRAVVLRGSASAAAKMLGISQPAVSKIIAQAEHRIGFALFDRRHGRMVPTAKAVTVFEQTAQLFTTLDRVNDIVGRLATGERAPVALGAVPLLATTLMPTVVKDTLIKRGFSAVVNTHDSVILTNQVATGQIEFALISAMHDIAGVESAPLALSPMFCAVPVDHPLAGHEELHVSDLAGHAYIGLSASEDIQTQLDQIFDGCPAPPQEVIRCPLMAGAIAMAELGIGLTFADAFAMRLARPGKLRFIRFAPDFHIEYRAIWPHGSTAHFGRDQLLAQCQRQAELIVSEAPVRRSAPS